jgi:sn-glycerol 3-phosphate transport system substrate-binding protein
MISRRMLLGTATAVALSYAPGGPAWAQVEIQWWHAMGGALGDKLGKMAEEFNKSQTQYKVVPVNKGTYPETMTAAIAAFRSGNPPHIVQVFEVGTATMMAAKGAVKPVHQLMKEAGEPFDPKSYLPAVTGYYTTPAGEMLSFPYNSSTPVLYVNKNAFQKAGLDASKPPRTWPEMGEAAKKLRAAGMNCGFTSTWMGWTQVENFSAWHNVPMGTKANGMAGLDTELKVNSPLHVKHVTQLNEWAKDKSFVYGGRRGDAQAKFTTGECGMLIESSAGYAGINRTKQGFDFGVSFLPYWPDAPGAPQNTIIGGASLWVMNGKKPEEYRGVAKFFSHLSKPEVQADWHQFTGYLPITPASYELTKSQGFYDKNPGTDVSIRQMTNKPPTDNSRGLRFGNMVQIRDVMDEEFEAMFGGRQDAKQTMDKIVQRGNALLRQFERDNK